MNDDVISRKSAIDAITDERIVANMDSVFDTELHRYKRAMQRILASLQTVQPENDDEVTFWKKRANEYEAMLFELTTKIEKGMTVDSMVINKDGIVFKGSQPERKKGTWIDLGEDRVICWQCSECGRKDTHIYNYCPDCGADMRKGEEDE